MSRRAALPFFVAFFGSRVLASFCQMQPGGPRLVEAVSEHLVRQLPVRPALARQGGQRLFEPGHLRFEVLVDVRDPGTRIELLTRPLPGEQVLHQPAESLGQRVVHQISELHWRWPDARGLRAALGPELPGEPHERSAATALTRLEREATAEEGVWRLLADKGREWLDRTPEGAAWLELAERTLSRRT